MGYDTTRVKLSRTFLVELVCTTRETSIKKRLVGKKRRFLLSNHVADFSNVFILILVIFQGNKYQYKRDDSKEQLLETLFAYLLERQVGS